MWPHITFGAMRNSFIIAMIKWISHTLDNDTLSTFDFSIYTSQMSKVGVACSTIRITCQDTGEAFEIGAEACKIQVTLISKICHQKFMHAK